MARTSPALLLLSAGGLLLLLLVLLHTPGAAAQPVPLPGNTSTPQGFTVICPDTYVLVKHLGTVTAQCTFYDMTRDSNPVAQAPAGVGTVPHSVKLSVAAYDPAGPHGWVANIEGAPIFSIFGGQTQTFGVRVQNTPQIDVADFRFELLVEYETPYGYKANMTIPFQAKVGNFDQALLTQHTYRQDVGQDEVATFTLEIANLGVFPDVYTVTASGPPGFFVTTPPSVYVPPHTSRNVTFSVLTPHNTLYELGRTYSMSFKAQSTTGSGFYTTSASLYVSGAYVPTYWIPLTLVGLVAAVVVARRTQESVETRRLEQGRPRRVEVTPRQAVLLAELKRADRGAYDSRKAQLDAIYAERRARYTEEHKAQVAKDREESRQARAEYAAAKKRAKVQHGEAARQRKVDKKAARAQAKIDRKAGKIEAKELKAKEKGLGKTRKVLEKARAKQAKIDAKQAIVDGKAALKAEREARKEAKAAAKAEKAAKKAKKGEEPPSGGQ